MKKNKGFTLIEMSVALAVSTIAVAILAVIIISISSVSSSKTYENNLQYELTQFKTKINSAFENYQSSEYTLNEISNSNEITFSKSLENFSIKFDNNSLFENSEELLYCKYINAVNFEKNNLFIKCSLNYGDNQKYIIMLNKRV